MATSACVGDATMVVAVDVLFATFTSLVVGAMFAVFEITVPDAVAAFTFTTSGSCAVVPDGIAAPEQTPPVPGQQLIAPVPPTAGSVVQVAPAGRASETKVVLAGTVSVKVTLLAEFGPLFAKFSRRVMLFPGVTGFGDAELVTLKSYWPAEATVTLTVELLLEGFGSGVEVEVLAVLVMTVPEAVPAVTVMIKVNVVVAPEGSDAMVQLTTVPGAGQLHAVPVCAREENVVCAGIASVNVTELVAAGPLLCTVTV
jgi:hypothetical protein